MDFETATVLLFFSCDNRPQLSEAEADEIQSAHLGFQFDLAQRGVLVTAGPFSQQSDVALRGMTILNVDAPTALELFANDPAVKRGVMRVETMTWHRPVGTAQFHQMRVPHDGEPLNL
jgi:uncharacterized protein YciI